MPFKPEKKKFDSNYYADNIICNKYKQYLM